MMELRKALDGVPDHRSSQGRRHPLGAILSLAVCAMRCGARSLYAIAQWGRDQGIPTGQLLALSLDGKILRGIHGETIPNDTGGASGVGPCPWERGGAGPGSRAG